MTWLVRGLLEELAYHRARLTYALGDAARAATQKRIRDIEAALRRVTA